MSPILSSIKGRLLALFLSAFFVVLTGLGFFLYNKLEGIVIGSIDNHLHSEVQLIAGLLETEEEGFELELSEAAVGDYSVSLSGHYYQVVLPDGRIIARSPSLSIPDATLPVVKKTGFEPLYTTIKGPRGEPLRLLAQSFRLPAGGLVIVEAAESLEEAEELLRLFRNTLLVVFPAVFIISGLGVLFITVWSLKPLERFSHKIGTITERNLNERIEETPCSELRGLAKSFNTMLSRLEESFERQKRFFTDASHELRTPTAVIKSVCDVTLSRKRSAAEYEEALLKIKRATEKLSELITRVLEVSRLESKVSSLKFEDVELYSLTTDVIRLLEPSATDNGITINLDGERVTIRADRERLSEAIKNIVDNAIKYNRTGGRVDVSVRSADGRAVITVRDTGIGIPQDKVGRIFERFYRVEESRGVSGTGLGLSIVKTIIDAHRGSIEVESELGKGTTFKVVLPLKR